jgi:hypothetical protein
VEETAIVESAQEQPQSELSVEDRFANAIGLGEEEKPQEQPVEEAQEEVTEETQEEAVDEDYDVLEINGEQYQVPKELKDGYLRQQDYTRKTQELAAERQTIQEQRQEIETERQAFQNQVMAQQQHFQLFAKVAAVDQQIAQYSQIDWQQLVDNDPVEAMKLDRSLRDLKESRNQMIQEAVQVQQQMDQTKQQQYAQLIEQGKKALQDKIPDWSADKAKELRNYGVSLGFTEDEMSSVVDPRHVVALHKAWLYDQLQSGKPETMKKVAQAPKTLQKASQAPKQSQQDVLKKIIRSSKDKQSKHEAIQKLIASRIK